MTKITKIFAVIASSLLVSFASVAGELTVTGSANASYLINGGVQNNNGKGIGISNELKFAASGELDNGYSWNYHMEIDPNGGGTMDNDDSALTINTGGMGTIGIFDSEGGLSTELGYGIGALGVGLDYANSMASSGHTAMNWGLDVSSHPNVQYHAPSDVLPFGITAKIGYAPNSGDGDSNSFKNSGGVAAQGADGGALQQYQVTAAPIDGLKVGIDYATGEKTSAANNQELTGGNYYAQYAIGNFKIGYMQGYKEKGAKDYANGDGTTNDSYEYDALGIEFALNDAVTISYDTTENEAKDKGAIAVGNKTRTTKVVTMEADTMQIAYNVGGATVGLFHIDTTNAEFTTGKDAKKTIASISMEF
jgi:hypothetical protein